MAKIIPQIQPEPVMITGYFWITIQPIPPVTEELYFISAGRQITTMQHPIHISQEQS